MRLPRHRFDRSTERSPLPSLLTTATRVRPLLLLALLLPLTALAQQFKLRGVVSDAGSGETLIGATVALKGTKAVTQTDLDGRFELLVNELPPYVLVISYVGFTDLEVEVKSPDQEMKLSLIHISEPTRPY